jgi:8-oxo-dGTP pyrophosphatase MutT (NUDIX family)
MSEVTMVALSKQVAALPWRKRKGRIEILLITSRETKRWVIPKGWPMVSLVDSNAAKEEAYEEAGVSGHIRRKSIGHFDYEKIQRDGRPHPIRVTVYPLEVADELKSWPEKRERKRQWFSVDDAVWHVNEAGLKDIIRRFG